MTETATPEDDPRRERRNQRSFSELMAEYQSALASASEVPCEESYRWVREARDALRNCPAVREIPAVRQVRADRQRNSPTSRW